MATVVIVSSRPLHSLHPAAIPYPAEGVFPNVLQLFFFFFTPLQVQGEQPEFHCSSMNEVGEKRPWEKPHADFKDESLKVSELSLACTEARASIMPGKCSATQKQPSLRSLRVDLKTEGGE